jgi:hypothetical protein
MVREESEEAHQAGRRGGDYLEEQEEGDAEPAQERPLRGLQEDLPSLRDGL